MSPSFPGVLFPFFISPLFLPSSLSSPYFLFLASFLLFTPSLNHFSLLLSFPFTVFLPFPFHYSFLLSIPPSFLPSLLLSLSFVRSFMFFLNLLFHSIASITAFPSSSLAFLSPSVPPSYLPPLSPFLHSRPHPSTS